MLNRVLLTAMALLLFSGTCLADTITGPIDKIDIKNYEITVSGKKVNVSTATVFTVNDMGVTKPVIIRDLKDHMGEVAVCYGSFNKDQVMEAYKVKVREGHR
jgi:hypothetical protein